MRKMKIKGKTGECEILVGESLANLLDYCKAEKCAIVTDAKVRGLHAGGFPEGFEVIEIGDGEENKTLASVEKIYQRLVKMEFDRSSMLLGMGGGIVTDITGFAASTYLRGIRFGFVPTTLIAQADAAVGGKNGVNFDGYKNIVGTFRQPEFVLIDFSLLRTLPARERSCGFAEVIKHAAIADAKLFEYLEEKIDEAVSLKQTVMEEIIYDSLKVKCEIVSADENEKDERRKLNFGHTFGHAFEKVCGLAHGEAVAIGMAVAADISVRKGILGKKDAERVCSLLKKAGLASEIPACAKGKTKEIVDAIRKDKKRASENVKMALLKGIGNAKICEVKLVELEAVANDLC